MAAYLAVNKNGDERIFEECPTYHRLKEQWVIETEREGLVYIDNYDYSAGTRWETETEYYYGVPLPKGSIKKLIGKNLTVMDEPFLIE
jgi:hypothetical protein|uniref:Uncharacterized protein n=1 Tax=Myoviridae sp. ctNQV2 TaxID=2827683 RepID=A0A8S5RZD6_9CAUD|nr:MAG TPA: hypothetical protein [Myoviridae sp. ctNQV2]